MKGTLIFLVLISGLFLSAFAAEVAARKGKLRHVVMLKFKDGTTQEQIGKVEQAFRDLKRKIPEIAALEWGTNNSPEKHDKGFTHCFILTFNTEKDRAVYLPHPDHKAFGNLLGPVLADVMVLDFWARD